MMAVCRGGLYQRSGHSSLPYSLTRIPSAPKLEHDFAIDQGDTIQSSSQLLMLVEDDAIRCADMWVNIPDPGQRNVKIKTDIRHHPAFVLRRFASCVKHKKKGWRQVKQ